MSPTRPAVPVTVLTGFLGSGKTTLVNRLLKERPGTRFGLVVNEFGEATLESQLLEVRREPLYELPSGCLCCVSDGDLKAALDAVVKKDSRVGHILVEASGLSSPGPLLGLLTRDEGPFTLNGVFCLADAASFLKHEPQFPALKRQLAFADAVFLTKTDLVDPATNEAVRARLTALKPGVKIFDTAQRLPWAALFELSGVHDPEADRADRTAPPRRFFQGGQHHEASVFEYTTDAPLDPEKLATVFSQLDEGILRAKGVLRVADPSEARFKYLVQYTGAQKQLYNRPWGPGEAHKTDLLFLGSDFDALSLKARLDECRVGGDS